MTISNNPAFFANIPSAEQSADKSEQSLITNHRQLIVIGYATLGLQRFYFG